MYGCISYIWNRRMEQQKSSLSFLTIRRVYHAFGSLPEDLRYPMCAEALQLEQPAKKPTFTAPLKICQKSDLDPSTPSNSRLHSIIVFCQKGLKSFVSQRYDLYTCFFRDERSTKSHKFLTLDSPHSIVHHSLVGCWCIQLSRLKWSYKKFQPRGSKGFSILKMFQDPKSKYVNLLQNHSTFQYMFYFCSII